MIYKNVFINEAITKSDISKVGFVRHLPLMLWENKQWLEEPGIFFLCCPSPSPQIIYYIFARF